jgi:hypothetical protein
MFYVSTNGSYLNGCSIDRTVARGIVDRIIIVIDRNGNENHGNQSRYNEIDSLRLSYSLHIHFLGYQIIRFDGPSLVFS